jgi:mannose-1-phosphate guanylyltransferase
MAGGAGTRFWPLSTDQKPKQFLKLFGEESLLQKSLTRLEGLIPPERVLVLTSEAFVPLVREQLPGLPPENVIGEPLRRDTAAAICLGAVLCLRRFGHGVMAVFSADHLIEPVDLFQKALASAARAARTSGALYTLGVPPTYPAVGYGYMEKGEMLEEDDGIQHFQLVRFKEKPNAETAREYVESGRFFWNSGIFVWTVDAIIEALSEHVPQHVRAICRAADFDHTPRWRDVLKTALDPLPTISIDYAVMEKAQNVRFVAAPFSWSDVGGWLALQNVLPQDALGNLSRGRVLSLESRENLVFCENKDETVLLVGVSDLIVVRSGHRTLVAHKSRAEEVKKLVIQLEQKDKTP